MSNTCDKLVSPCCVAFLHATTQVEDPVLDPMPRARYPAVAAVSELWNLARLHAAEDSQPTCTDPFREHEIRTQDAGFFFHIQRFSFGVMQLWSDSALEPFLPAWQPLAHEPGLCEGLVSEIVVLLGQRHGCRCDGCNNGHHGSCYELLSLLRIA